MYFKWAYTVAWAFFPSTLANELIFSWVEDTFFWRNSFNHWVWWFIINFIYLFIENVTKNAMGMYEILPLINVSGLKYGEPITHLYDCRGGVKRNGWSFFGCLNFAMLSMLKWNLSIFDRLMAPPSFQWNYLNLGIVETQCVGSIISFIGPKSNTSKY